MNEILYTKQFEIKLADGDSGAFEGFCSVYNNVDSAGDAVQPGAFRKTIAERGKSVPLLWQHDSRQPIGTGEVFETSSGLGIRGRILSTVSRGREAIALLREGVIKGLSIGYQAVKHDWDSVRKIRLLKEIKLYEVSIVTFPANELATVTATTPKDGSKADHEAVMLQALREIRGGGDPFLTALREFRHELEGKRRRAA